MPPHIHSVDAALQRPRRDSTTAKPPHPERIGVLPAFQATVAV